MTVWREVRRFARSELAESIINKIGNEKLKQIVEAADTGNWKEFVELNRGPTVARKDQLLQRTTAEELQPTNMEKLPKNYGASFIKGAGLSRPKLEHGKLDWLMYRNIMFLMRGFL